MLDTSRYLSGRSPSLRLRIDSTDPTQLVVCKISWRRVFRTGRACEFRTILKFLRHGSSNAGRTVAVAAVEQSQVVPFRNNVRIFRHLVFPGGRAGRQ